MSPVYKAEHRTALVYMDSSIAVNHVYVCSAYCNRRARSGEGAAMGPLANSPEDYIAWVARGTPGIRGMLLGACKCVIPGVRDSGLLFDRGGLPYYVELPFSKRSGILSIHAAVRKAGWYGIVDELRANTARLSLYELHDGGCEGFPHVLLPGVRDASQLDRLGYGWNEIRGNDRAMELLEGFTANLHSIMFGS